MSSQQSGEPRANTQTRLLRNLDRVCDRFEAAWCAGLNPLIEDYIEGVMEPLRSRLLRELVALEVSYLRQSGQTPAYTDYETRFPADAETAREGFGCSSPITTASSPVMTELPPHQPTGFAEEGGLPRGAKIGRYSIQ